MVITFFCLIIFSTFSGVYGWTDGSEDIKSEDINYLFITDFTCEYYGLVPVIASQGTDAANTYSVCAKAYQKAFPYQSFNADQTYNADRHPVDARSGQFVCGMVIHTGSSPEIRVRYVNPEQQGEGEIEKYEGGWDNFIQICKTPDVKGKTWPKCKEEPDETPCFCSSDTRPFWAMCGDGQLCSPQDTATGGDNIYTEPETLLKQCEARLCENTDGTQKNNDICLCKADPDHFFPKINRITQTCSKEQYCWVQDEPKTDATYLFGTCLNDPACKDGQSDCMCGTNAGTAVKCINGRFCVDGECKCGTKSNNIVDCDEEKQCIAHSVPGERQCLELCVENHGNVKNDVDACSCDGDEICGAENGYFCYDGKCRQSPKPCETDSKFNTEPCDCGNNEICSVVPALDRVYLSEEPCEYGNDIADKVSCGAFATKMGYTFNTDTAVDKKKGCYFASGGYLHWNGGGINKTCSESEWCIMNVCGSQQYEYAAAPEYEIRRSDKCETDLTKAECQYWHNNVREDRLAGSWFMYTNDKNDKYFMYTGCAIYAMNNNKPTAWLDPAFNGDSVCGNNAYCICRGVLPGDGWSDRTLEPAECKYVTEVLKLPVDDTECTNIRSRFKEPRVLGGIKDSRVLGGFCYNEESEKSICANEPISICIDILEQDETQSKQIEPSEACEGGWKDITNWGICQSMGALHKVVDVTYEAIENDICLESSSLFLIKNKDECELAYLQINGEFKDATEDAQQSAGCTIKDGQLYFNPSIILPTSFVGSSLCKKKETLPMTYHIGHEFNIPDYQSGCLLVGDTVYFNNPRSVQWPSDAPFTLISSGRCADTDGYRDVRTKAECEHMAEILWDRDAVEYTGETYSDPNGNNREGDDRADWYYYGDFVDWKSSYEARPVGCSTNKGVNFVWNTHGSEPFNGNRPGVCISTSLPNKERTSGRCADGNFLTQEECKQWAEDNGKYHMGLLGESWRDSEPAGCFLDDSASPEYVYWNPLLTSTVEFGADSGTCICAPDARDNVNRPRKYNIVASALGFPGADSINLDRLEQGFQTRKLCSKDLGFWGCHCGDNGEICDSNKPTCSDNTCFAESACLYGDGSEPLGSSCLCGGDLCGPGSENGNYCISELRQCNELPVCKNHLGQDQNTNECMCGDQIDQIIDQTNGKYELRTSGTCVNSMASEEECKQWAKNHDQNYGRALYAYELQNLWAPGCYIAKTTVGTTLVWWNPLLTSTVDCDADWETCICRTIEYELRTSNKCADGNFLTEEACKQWAEDNGKTYLGLLGVDWRATSAPGCFMDVRDRDSLGHVYWNPLLASTLECNANSDTCICNIGWKPKNKCDENQYCYKPLETCEDHKNKVNDVPICKFDPLEKNDDICFCGTKKCSKPNQYCLHDSEECFDYPKCPVVTLAMSNLRFIERHKSCMCGTAKCDSSTPYCNSASNTCERIECADKSGRKMSKIECKCGADTCGVHQYCHESGSDLCRDSPVCPSGLSDDQIDPLCRCVPLCTSGTYCMKKDAQNWDCAPPPDCSGDGRQETYCKCGTNTCSPTNYCRSGTCLDLLPCENTDGTVVQSECTCGPVENICGNDRPYCHTNECKTFGICENTDGTVAQERCGCADQICENDNNYCHGTECKQKPVCKDTSGTVAENSPCLCSTAECEVGDFCSSGVCKKVPSCVNKIGTIKNNLACECGTAKPSILEIFDPEGLDYAGRSKGCENENNLSKEQCEKLAEIHSKPIEIKGVFAMGADHKFPRGCSSFDGTFIYNQGTAWDGWPWQTSDYVRCGQTGVDCFCLKDQGGILSCPAGHFCHTDLQQCSDDGEFRLEPNGLSLINSEIEKGVCENSDIIKLDKECFCGDKLCTMGKKCDQDCIYPGKCKLNQLNDEPCLCHSETCGIGELYCHRNLRYDLVTSGSCSFVGSLLTSEAECKQWAEDNGQNYLGLLAVNWRDRSPAGCFIDYSTSPEYVYWNPLLTSTVECGADSGTCICGVVPRHKFITSGFCSDGEWTDPIDTTYYRLSLSTQNECQKWSVERDTAWGILTNLNLPPGCIADPSNGVRWNAALSSTIECGSDSWSCICNSQDFWKIREENFCSLDECKITNGLDKNVDACACGTFECSADQYCFKNHINSTCSSIDICTEGLESLSAPCRCGTGQELCSKGEYCYPDVNKCAIETQCVHKNGLLPNDESCYCTNTLCEAGDYCSDDLKECSDDGLFGDAKQPVCEYQSMEAFHNDTQSCWCGSNTCTGTELACDYSNSQCSILDCSSPNVPYMPYIGTCKCGTQICSKDTGFECSDVCGFPEETCDYIYGLTPNSDSCKCGSFSCNRANPYCHTKYGCSSKSEFESKSVCIYLDKELPTNAECLCGDVVCSPGQLCSAESSTCVDIQDCESQSPFLPNDGTSCVCKRSAYNPCPASHPFLEKYSTSNLYWCYQKPGNVGPCRMLNSGLPAPPDGSWGTSQADCVNPEYISTIQLACPKGTNICDPIDERCYTMSNCVFNDNRTQNSRACQCGNAECNSNSGLICDDVQCYKPDLCPNTDPFLINSRACQCGDFACDDYPRCSNICQSNSFCSVEFGKCSDIQGFRGYRDATNGVCEELNSAELLSDSYWDSLPNISRAILAELEPLLAGTNLLSIRIETLPDPRPVHLSPIANNFCLYAPKCEQNYGNIENAGECICVPPDELSGSLSSGIFYCSVDRPFCSTDCHETIKCDEKFGIIANSDCSCGTGLSQCRKNKNPFCIEAESQCLENGFCTESDGISENALDCLCGTDRELCTKEIIVDEPESPLTFNCDENYKCATMDQTEDIGDGTLGEIFYYSVLELQAACEQNPECTSYEWRPRQALGVLCKAGSAAITSTESEEWCEISRYIAPVTREGDGGTGRYCVSADSTCWKYGPCVDKSGTSSIENVCRCGTFECSAGQYCYDEIFNICKPSPVNICQSLDGYTISNEKCWCKADNECPANRYCDMTGTTDTTICRTTPKCVYTEGKMPNTVNCECFDGQETTTTNKYCYKSLKRVSPYPNEIKKDNTWIQQCDLSGQKTPESGTCICGNDTCNSGELYCLGGIPFEWGDSTGYLHSCDQFKNELGPYTFQNTGDALVTSCEIGQSGGTCTGGSEESIACDWGGKLKNNVPSCKNNPACVDYTRSNPNTQKCYCGVTEVCDKGNLCSNTEGGRCSIPFCRDKVAKSKIDSRCSCSYNVNDFGPDCDLRDNDGNPQYCLAQGAENQEESKCRIQNVLYPICGCTTEQLFDCRYADGFIMNMDIEQGMSCVCGNTVCLAGEYCNAEFSVCSADSPIQSCAFTEGIKVNQNPCLCGTEACPTGGFYCDPSRESRKCHKQLCSNFPDPDLLCDFEGYGNGVEKNRECAKTTCDKDDREACCKRCSGDYRVIDGSCRKLCTNNVDNSNQKLCNKTNGWIPVTTTAEWRLLNTEDVNYLAFISRIAPEYNAFCGNTVCDIQDQSTCCFPAKQCKSEDPYVLCNGESFTGEMPDTDKFCEGVECTAEECCTQIECKCIGGTPASGLLCPDASQYKCVKCDPEKWLNGVVCMPTKQCLENEYESKPPTETSDRECLPITSCHSAQYQTVAPTETSDRECEVLTVCNETEYISTPAGINSNRECSPINICKEGEEYETKAPSQTAGQFNENRECSQLTPKCVEGEQYESQSPDATTNRECTDFVIECSDSQYEYQGRTNISDRVCLSYQTCVSGEEYESRGPTNISDRQCTKLRVCVPGEEYESRGPMAHSDRQCRIFSECADDFFESKPPAVDSDRECTRIKICLENEYESKPPTVDSDRECSTCTDGDLDCRGCIIQDDCDYNPLAKVIDRTKCFGKNCKTIIIKAGSPDPIVSVGQWFRFQPEAGHTFTLSAPNKIVGNGYEYFRVAGIDDAISLDGRQIKIKQDCQIDQYIWQGCSVRCGSGRELGFRGKIIQQPQNGGTPCSSFPKITDRPCEGQFCPVHCIYDWDVTIIGDPDFGPCDAPCGKQGIQYQNYTIKQHPENDGEACPALNKRGCIGTDPGYCDCKKNVLDQCQVCGGNGDTCLGCDNVPNSGYEWNACGECMPKGSPCSPQAHSKFTKLTKKQEKSKKTKTIITKTIVPIIAGILLFVSAVIGIAVYISKKDKKSDDREIREIFLA